MRNYHKTVVMAVDKHCAASGRPLQAESAASEIQSEKNAFAENSAITNKSMNKRRFAVMSSLQYQDMIAVLSVISLKAETQRKCFDKIMLLLHEVGFNVIGICVDNATANRKFYKEFLCGGYWQNSIKKSFSEGRIFLLFDPIHIVKNIYYNFLPKKVFKMPMLSTILSQNLTAKFSDVKNVYDLERHKPLRIAHKLTETVLNPKTIEKVNVKLAMSLLHKSTRTALKQYEFVETATALEFFAKFCNIINVSSPTIGKHKRDIFRDPAKSPDDWKLDYFLELEKYLNFWENSMVSSKRNQ